MSTLLGKEQLLDVLTLHCMKGGPMAPLTVYCRHIDFNGYITLHIHTLTNAIRILRMILYYGSIAEFGKLREHVNVIQYLPI